MEFTKFDFNNWAKQFQSHLDQWRKEAVEYISSGKGDSITKACGNSILIATKKTYSHEPDNPIVHIIEVKNGYTEYKYPILLVEQK